MTCTPGHVIWQLGKHVIYIKMFNFVLLTAFQRYILNKIWVIKKYEIYLIYNSWIYDNLMKISSVYWSIHFAFVKNDTLYT